MRNDIARQPSVKSALKRSGSSQFLQSLVFFADSWQLFSNPNAINDRREREKYFNSYCGILLGVAKNLAHSTGGVPHRAMIHELAEEGRKTLNAPGSSETFSGGRFDDARAAPFR